VKNAICGTPLGLVIDGSVACYPLAGRPSALFAGNAVGTINESG
jgi:hypothetical protein